MKTILFAGLSALLLFSCSKDNPVQYQPVSTFLPTSPLDTTITLITLNMAVGFDAENMLTRNLSNPRVVLEEGRALYQGLVDSKPRERVRVMADSLSHLAPDVICLQEVLYLENHQDSQVFDFLKELLAAIDSLHGPSYTAIKQIMNPIPIQVNVSDSQGVDSQNIYFHEGNTVLYKASVLTPVSTDSFTYFLGIRNRPYLNSTLSILRGAQFVRFSTARGTFINVVNTHLEVEAIPSVGMGQATELRDYLRDKLTGNETVVALGDFNDEPDGRRVGLFLSENFIDTYGSGRPGLTCCYDIKDASALPTSRIDHILARSVVNVNASGIGLNGVFMIDTVSYRVSDHAAVMATLTFH